MLGSCEKKHCMSWQQMKQQERRFHFFFLLLCYEVHFQAMDPPLGNVFCSLTGPGSDAMSQVMFPSPDSVSLALPLRAPPASCLSDASQHHQPTATNIQMKVLC